MNKKIADIPFSQVNQDRLEPAEPYFEERMKDPGFAKAYEDETARLRIASIVREHRKHLHMSQKQLAEKAETSQKTVSKIEHGTFSIGVDLLQRVAEALDLRLELHPKHN
jgi:ribosome-binding protein aMBF1 (putative translation factor)